MTAHKHKETKTHHHAKHHHRTHPVSKNSYAWVLATVVVLGLLFVAANYAVSDKKMDSIDDQTSPTKPISSISDEEQKQIDQWIKDNNLNQYGDPKSTMYIGGTPLFDETTGKYRDLYGYIVERHPDRPWRK